MAKMTPDEAREAGFIVDQHCYPWAAYKGPRFRPDELHSVLTDLEARLLASLEAMTEWASPDGLDDGEPFPEAREAMKEARA